MTLLLSQFICTSLSYRSILVNKSECYHAAGWLDYSGWDYFKCCFGVITVHNSSCGKVMFSQSVQRGRRTTPWQADTTPGRRDTSRGRHPQADPLRQTPTPGQTSPLGRHPPPETATAADGTHPTGMHFYLVGIIFSVVSELLPLNSSRTCFLFFGLL